MKSFKFCKLYFSIISALRNLGDKIGHSFISFLKEQTIEVNKSRTESRLNPKFYRANRHFSSACWGFEDQQHSCTFASPPRSRLVLLVLILSSRTLRNMESSGGQEFGKEFAEGRVVKAIDSKGFQLTTVRSVPNDSLLCGARYSTGDNCYSSERKGRAMERGSEAGAYMQLHAKESLVLVSCHPDRINLQ